jgi:hypothetical protein
VPDNSRSSVTPRLWRDQRTDRRSGVGTGDDTTTGPLANLLVQPCKPADAECMRNTLVPASRAWSPSEVAAAAYGSHAAGGYSGQDAPEAP